jgi:hypothetical protein
LQCSFTTLFLKISIQGQGDSTTCARVFKFVHAEFHGKLATRQWQLGCKTTNKQWIKVAPNYNKPWN